VEQVVLFARQRQALASVIVTTISIWMDQESAKTALLSAQHVGAPTTSNAFLVIKDFDLLIMEIRATHSVETGRRVHLKSVTMETRTVVMGAPHSVKLS
jgi:hypothetical protein